MHAHTAVHHTGTLSLKLKRREGKGQLGLRVTITNNTCYVHILCGEDLPAADPMGYSDPYCKVCCAYAYIEQPY
jgi:hypothetical protein